MPNLTSVFSGRIVDILQGVRWEFEETPGLSLTIEDACRRWPLRPAHLSVLLDTLVDVGFLQREGNGGYRRRADLTTH